MPDEPHLFEYLTVEEHLRFVARLYGVTDVAARLPGVLRELDLADRRGSLPEELSRGMRQKLAIGCALIHDPRALLLDEPLTGLDPVGIRRMKTTIVEHARAGAAVLLSSHLLHLVEEICTRVLIMRQRPGARLRDDRGDRPRETGPRRQESRGRLSRHRGRRGRGRVVTSPLWYLAGRSTRNRLARQLRRLRTPRYALALVLGLAYLWFVGIYQRSSSTPPKLSAASLELMAAAGVLGIVAWVWVFGADRRALAFSRAEVTFLFPAPVTRRELVHYKLLRGQLVILFNTVLWTALFTGGWSGSAPWRRALAIWTVLTTLALHRLGIALLRGSLVEHGVRAARARAITLVGVRLHRGGLSRWSCGRCCPLSARAGRWDSASSWRRRSVRLSARSWRRSCCLPGCWSGRW